MATPKIFSGARALVEIQGAEGKPIVVGIFTSLSYGVTYDAQPAYVLGAYGPREIDYTSMEPVSISASGWRVVRHGPHKQVLFPTVGELMNHGYVQFTVTDRATKEVIATIRDVRPLSYNTPIGNRQLVEQSFSFIGMLLTDESSNQLMAFNEDGTASSIPDPDAGA